MRFVWSWLKGGAVGYVAGGPIPSRRRYMLVQLCLWIYSVIWLSGWIALIVWRDEVSRWMLFASGVVLFIFAPPVDELFRRYHAYEAELRRVNSAIDDGGK